MVNDDLPKGYGDFLKDIKSRIRAAQIKAALSVNRELISLYWHIEDQDHMMRSRAISRLVLRAL